VNDQRSQRSTYAWAAFASYLPTGLARDATRSTRRSATPFTGAPPSAAANAPWRRNTRPPRHRGHPDAVGAATYSRRVTHQHTVGNPFRLTDRTINHAHDTATADTPAMRRLTARERRVLAFMAEGLSNVDIGLLRHIGVVAGALGVCRDDYFPSLIRSVSVSGRERYAVGDPLVDHYLEFVAGRARPVASERLCRGISALVRAVSKAGTRPHRVFAWLCAPIRRSRQDSRPGGCSKQSAVRAKSLGETTATLLSLRGRRRV
jgi:hypothetical protein